MATPTTLSATVFKKIFIEFQNKVYYYALKKTNSEYLADEIVQLTFIKLWENRKKICVEIPVANQIFQITKSIIIDLYRKGKCKEKAEKEFIETASNNPSTIYELIHKKEMNLFVNQLIDQLPPKRSLIFRMNRLEELSYKEIAAKLEISVKTVENQISSALKNIKSKILN